MDYEKKYKDALEWARKVIQGKVGSVLSEVLEKFPELKENEDERIIKSFIRLLKAFHDVNFPTPEGFERKDMIAWLEKQGEQKTAEDVDILYRFSFYSYKDEPNILYLSGLYVNKEQRNKGIGTNILKIADKVTTTMKCSLIRLKTEIGSNAERLYRKNGYNSLKREGNQIWLEKQGEQILDNSAKTCKDAQNPAWSEEDEKKLSRIYSILGQVADEHAFCNTCRLIGDKECVELQDWLKTLEDRYFSLPKHEWNENEL